MTQGSELPFWVNGPIEPESPSYVRRKADTDIWTALLTEHKYAVVVGPRQQGKTSLIRQLQNRLCDFPGVLLAYVSTDSLRNDSEAAWYEDLGRRLAEQLGIPPQVESGSLPLPANKGDWAGFLEHILNCTFDQANPVSTVVIVPVPLLITTTSASSVSS